MTKKVLFGMAAFTMLFATSCQNELDVFSSGETSTVSFNVLTPEIQSRAYSDGKTAKVLQWAVYSVDKTGVLTMLEDLDGTKAIDLKTTVDFSLTTGNKYAVIFWAGAEGAPYSVDFANKTMTVDYTAAKTVSNDEKRDAFYKYQEFTVTGAMDVAVELKRPFAQLNIGTADFAKSKSAGYVPTYSSVKVSNVFTTLNLVNGAVSNSTTEANAVTFAPGVIPTTFDATTNVFTGEKFPVDGYDYLAMNYLLVDAEKELVDIEFTYGTSADDADAKKRIVGSVPVQRNYRTNIYGNLLTSLVNINVEINPDYEEPDYNIHHVHVAGEVYTDFAEAVAKAIELGEPVEFVEDIAIDADNTITVPEGKTLTLNLNGKTLSGVTDDADKNDDGTITSADNEVMFDVRGTMNINNGIVTIKHKAADMGTAAMHEIAYVGFKGTLNVNNATLENYGGTYMAYCIDMVNAATDGGVTVNVNNSTIKSSYIPVRVFNNGAGMNNVTISNTTLEGVSRAFWVHIYTQADQPAFFSSGKDTDNNGYKNETLNINIFNPAQNNTFIASNPQRIIEYGFTNEINFDDCGNLYANNAAAVQAMLDNAVNGTTIRLKSGVNYGTLYLRPVAGQENTITDRDYLIYSNEMLRKVENLTIVGAPNATIDAIAVVSGHIEGSTGYVVNIKNLVVDGVEFTDDYVNPNTAHKYSAPLFFDLSYINVDGLTVKNCKLAGNNEKMNFVYFYGSGKPSNSTFDTAAKNITITGNTVDGIARLCELRQAENVVITNNIIKNTALHGILLPVDGGTYSGNVTITGNTADGIKERFVRMAGAGDAVVSIKNNTITNYLGEDADFIKVTDGTNVTIENTTFSAKNAAAAQAVLDNAFKGTTIQLLSGVNYGTLYLRPVNGGAATKEVDWQGNNYRYETYSLFENLTILGATGATVDAIKIEGGTYYNTEHSQKDLYPVMLSLIELKNVKFDGVTFTGNGGYDPQGHGNAINLSGSNIKVDGLTLQNCKLNNSANKARLLYKTEATNTVHTYTYDGGTFTFSPTLKDITVSGCIFNGGYIGIELRETENVTIINNEFNVADRNILLPVNVGCTYSGNITITGNISNNAKERFVRADGTGDAVVVIKDNTIKNYQGTDADYIKVTNGNNVTIENNSEIN